MALIKCPKCGKYNTKTSTKCFSCNYNEYPFSPDNIDKYDDDDDDYTPIQEPEIEKDNWFTEYKKFHPWDWWIKLDKMLD